MFLEPRWKGTSAAGPSLVLLYEAVAPTLLVVEVPDGMAAVRVEEVGSTAAVKFDCWVWAQLQSDCWLQFVPPPGDGTPAVTAAGAKCGLHK